MLIGCKTDLRKDKEQLRKLRAAQLEPITYTQVGQGPSYLPCRSSIPQKAIARSHLLCCLLNWSLTRLLGALKQTRV